MILLIINESILTINMMFTTGIVYFDYDSDYEGVYSDHQSDVYQGVFLLYSDYDSGFAVILS